MKKLWEIYMLWNICGNVLKVCGASVETYGKSMKNLYGTPVETYEKSLEICGKSMEYLWNVFGHV